MVEEGIWFRRSTRAAHNAGQPTAITTVPSFASTPSASTPAASATSGIPTAVSVVGVSGPGVNCPRTASFRLATVRVRGAIRWGRDSSVQAVPVKLGVRPRSWAAVEPIQVQSGGRVPPWYWSRIRCAWTSGANWSRISDQREGGTGGGIQVGGKLDTSNPAASRLRQARRTLRRIRWSVKKDENLGGIVLIPIWRPFGLREARQHL
jgi:hypothetical protein